MEDQILDPKRLVLLDRDGVVNFDSDDYIKSPEEWQPIPGSLEAIAKLNKSNIDVCVVTNQSGIGRGYYSEDTLHAMHQKMADLLSPLGGHITDIAFCPHHPDDACDCRKPNTGMLDILEKKFRISVAGVPFIGDTSKDLELATRKRCLPILVKTGKGQAFYDANFSSSPWASSTEVFENLEQACEHLLSHHFS